MAPLRFDVRTRGAAVKIEGVAELKAALAELSNEVATKIGVAADRKAAKAMAEVMVSLAPFAARASTMKYWKTKKNGTQSADYGHLRDNIRVRRARATTDNKVVFNISTGNAFWGYFLEYGTINMQARPFMRPAFDAFRQQAIDIQIGELRGGIERVAKRVKKGRPVNAKGRNT